MARRNPAKSPLVVHQPTTATDREAQLTGGYPSAYNRKSNGPGQPGRGRYEVGIPAAMAKVRSRRAVSLHFIFDGNEFPHPKTEAKHQYEEEEPRAWTPQLISDSR